ncbi:MAG: class I SAM-dependent methyltransferase [Anaerolineae bacterium]|nr:class I SAM-dependent methyltransferase [Anaerolineae bacterium]
MMRFFDQRYNRLIYVNQSATPDFWDDQWRIDRSVRQKIINVKSTFVTQMTRKYLSPDDGVILEGGCGTGIHVAALQNNGFQCIGLDYAPTTVQVLNKAVPELDIRQGDVRCLDFEDAYFAGYWSLGVIEHFWAGYEPLGLEMARVIKSGGYLFLTFPYLSSLRKLKAKLNLYPNWTSTKAPNGFYQFALNHQSVIQNFTEWGFELVNRGKPMLGLRATKEELGPLNPLLERLYDYKGGSILPRSLALTASLVFTPISGHMILLVLKKK